MKEKLKIISLAFIFGLLGGGIAYYAISLKPQEIKIVEQEKIIPTATFAGNQNMLELPDFTKPASNALQAVVFIKTEFFSGDPLTYFLYGKSYDTPIKGSGSGVIISKEGYIVTNNHVIDKATNIKVVLNDKREYDAKLIGRDPRTDLALIKIEAENLDILEFGNSDDLKVGEWVLAIGNPFNLTSTVTAGIVSAKARDISILKKQYAIESFIQTDAAINPGNSGGALINISGKLIGINSAIASPTGSYTGYSFAIPSSIVQKVVADFVEYGSVQRAILGVKIADITPLIAKEFDLPNLDGIYISNVLESGAAGQAGIQNGDVILKFDNIEVTEVSQLLDLIGRHRPGDNVTLSIRRNNSIEDYKVTLQNEIGGTDNIPNNLDRIFGASFEELTQQEKQRHSLRYGVKVAEVFPGKFLSAGIRSGIIITKINNRKVNSVKEVESLLKSATEGIYIEAYNPQTGKFDYYAFGIR